METFVSPATLTTDTLFDATKTLLRIAMLESSPLGKSGFAVADYCDAVRRAAQSKLLGDTLRLCETLGLEWAERPRSDQWAEDNIAMLNQRTFDETAFRFAALPLIDLGLGSWSQEGGFKLVFSLINDRPIDIADTYFETRHNMAKIMGGVQMLFPSNAI
ncbi:MAG: hypothetical protein ABJQ34_04990 [Paracoccaceae bacterium]